MFTLEECNKIISYSKIFPLKTSDGSYPGYDKIQYTGWHILNNAETKWVFDRLFDEFTKQTNIQLIDRPDRFGLHKYVKGEMFARHHDARDMNRLYNIGTNLNDSYSGGDFILYDPEITLTKTPGEIYVFESLREHEVKEITDGERWSLIMFIWNKHTKKSKLL